MKIPTALILGGITVFCRLTAAAPEETAKAPAQQPGGDLETLVRDLGDESFRVREKASRDLWSLGESAVSALNDAVESGDPEKALRARDLLRKIRLHITPDTDPAVIALVERYLKASPSEKSILLVKMRARRAWRQMLKLYAGETDPGLRVKLSSAMKDIAVKAARARLLEGDSKEAREFLEMAPANAENLLALAEFHRSHGSLEAELEKARSVQGRKAAAWRLALERAAGDLHAALADAKLADELRIGAAMAALTGDPLPWLHNEGVDSEPGEDSVAEAYSRIAINHWLGQKAADPDLEWLVKSLSGRSSRRQDAALNALFLLGEAEAAEPVFAEAKPLAAFQHFLALERIPEALSALGLDPDHPDDKAWVAKRVNAIETDDIEDQHSPPTNSAELVALANFLERRGLHQQAFDTFSPALTDYAAKDETQFADFLGELYGSMEILEGAPILATRIGISWAGEDDRRWDDLILAAFGDDDLLNHWWDWLATLDPKASRADRFHGMLALYGIGTDSTGLRKRWLDLAWQAVEASPEADRDHLLERISELVIQSGDVANGMRAWEQMSPEARKSVFWAQHVVHLSALERWDDAAAVFLEQIETLKAAEQEPGGDLHAYAAAALRRAGHEQEAAVHDEWADKLALGNPATAMSIGNGYAYGCDYQRAAEWWARAVREADPDSVEFAMAAKLHADALLEAGKWRETAAISEVLAQIQAGSGFRWSNSLPLLFMRQRLQADTARALTNLSTDRAGSIALLEKCHHDFASDGSLADFFFPALRKAGLMEEHNRWFGKTWEIMEKVIRKYPDSDNTRNTAAWFASRARLKLDVAEKYLTEALAAHPRQSAYLDTMAEIQFAKGNREKALEWSNLAINFAPDDSQLRRQHEHFRSDPLPE